MKLSVAHARRKWGVDPDSVIGAYEDRVGEQGTLIEIVIVWYIYQREIQVLLIEYGDGMALNRVGPFSYADMYRRESIGETLLESFADDVEENPVCLRKWIRQAFVASQCERLLQR